MLVTNHQILFHDAKTRPQTPENVSSFHKLATFGQKSQMCKKQYLILGSECLHTIIQFTLSKMAFSGRSLKVSLQKPCSDRVNDDETFSDLLNQFIDNV